MRGFIKLFSYPALLLLIMTLGWQQSIMAQTSGGVSGFTILSNSSPGFSVTTASRFAWLLEDVEINKDAPINAKKAQEMVRNAIAEDMQMKGLPISPVGSPSDYHVAYTLATESTLDDETLMKRYNISPGVNTSSQAANIYEKGTLLIHIIDAKTRQTVWQSAVQAGIQYDISEDQRRANIRSVVRTMLRNFPVTKE